jgi:hypothetical protein
MEQINHNLLFPSASASKLSYIGHALMENRNGLVVAAMLTPASGTAEREAALKMIVQRSPGSRRLTLGADKGYDTKTFVADLRDLNIASHVAQNTINRASRASNSESCDRIGTIEKSLPPANSPGAAQHAAGVMVSEPQGMPSGFNTRFVVAWTKSIPGRSRPSRTTT